MERGKYACDDGKLFIYPDNMRLIQFNLSETTIEFFHWFDPFFFNYSREKPTW